MEAAEFCLMYRGANTPVFVGLAQGTSHSFT